MTLEFAPPVCTFETSTHPRAYNNALITFHKNPDITIDKQWKLAQKSGFNVFNFPANALLVDLLSDSGTTTITPEQLGAMVASLGKEAYGNPEAYETLIATLKEIFGIDTEEWEIYLCHQGRAAEHALFLQLGKILPERSIIPSNGHFDTTRANIETNKIVARDVLVRDDEIKGNELFQGNMSIAGLQKALMMYEARIPLVYATITNNRIGGLAVSLKNLKTIREWCSAYRKSFFLDACRFAENAWFIKQYEPEYKDKTIQEIAHEMFSLCDGFTISFKKDGLSHMGGALAIRKKSLLALQYPSLLENLRSQQQVIEGNDKQGGMTLMDMASISVGLQQVIKKEYLDGRIHQVETFGMELARAGIPVIQPFGGHAIYIDVDKFFEGTKMKRDDFGGIALTALLLLKGVRACELGAFAFGKWNKATGKEEFSGRNLVRCAVPRLKYEEQDLKYAADCIRGLFDRKDQIPRAIPIHGREKPLRHMSARFRLESI